MGQIDQNKILIFGGTGSLGQAFVKRYLKNNQIYLYSRDESKHWAIDLEYNNHSNLSFIIGDIRNRDKVAQTIIRINPDLIIIAAAMKHIEKCEYETKLKKMGWELPISFEESLKKTILWTQEHSEWLKE